MSHEKEVNGTFGLCVCLIITVLDNMLKGKKSTPLHKKIIPWHARLYCFQRLSLATKNTVFPNFLPLCIFCEKVAKNKCLSTKTFFPHYPILFLDKILFLICDDIEKTACKSFVKNLVFLKY